MPSYPRGKTKKKKKKDKAGVVTRRPRLLHPGTWECGERHTASVTGWDFLPPSISVLLELTDGWILGRWICLVLYPPWFQSALTKAYGFKYHLYADGSHVYVSSPILSPKLPYILLLAHYFHEDANRHLKLNMSRLTHSFFLPPTCLSPVFSFY